MSQPKRHHTVPRFYLSAFAAGKRLDAVNVETGDEHTTNVADASVESNFYTLPGDQSDSIRFEAALSSAEGAAAAVYRSIVGGKWPLAPDERTDFAEFMTLQFLRVQGHRTQMHHAIAADLRALAESNPQELERILALPGAPSGVDLTSPDFPPLISAAVHLQQISTLIPQLTGHLLRRPWELISFDRPSLLTSDEPLTPLQNPEAPHSVGLGLENSWVLMFPLTRQLGLLMFRDQLSPVVDSVADQIALGSFDTTRSGDPESSALFNTNAAMHAHRFLFHHPDDAHLVPVGLVELAKRGGRINMEGLPEGLPPAP